VQDVAARAHGHALLGRDLGNGSGDILELEGDDIDPTHEVAHGVQVIVGRADLTVGDLTGGRILFG
jgi:hypothetical protein